MSVEDGFPSDPNGPCIYCGGLVMQGMEHMDICPMVTGLYPVIEQDLRFGFSCTVCGDDLGLGDMYTERKSGEGIGDIVCLTCAAFNREGSPS